jgi:AcrR family transcriptional regulator
MRYGGGMSTLRERKRVAAMRRVQDAAYDLFEREGFDRVTIEQVAAAAEVSPSSVYRYFGTKEQLVLWDEYDPAAFQRFAEELATHPPLEAFRRAVAGVGDRFFGPDEARIRRMTTFAYEEPSVHRLVLHQLEDAAQGIATLTAGSIDRGPGDLEVQVFARAVVSVIDSGLRYWYRQGFEPDLAAVIDEGLALLAGGFEFA